MLRNRSLAACFGIAATLAVVATVPAGAQSAADTDQPRQEPSATAQPSDSGAPAVATAPQAEVAAPPDAPGGAPAAEHQAAAQPVPDATADAQPATPEVPAANPSAPADTAAASEPAAPSAPAATETTASPAAAPAEPPVAETPAAAPAAPVAESPAAAPAGTAAAPPPAPGPHPVVVEVRTQLDATKLAGATAAERTALTAFYAEREAPVWVTTTGLTDRARHVMAEIAQADDWGLSARDFVLPTWTPGEVAPAALADTEIKLAVAVLRYARYARGGRLEPSSVSRNFDQKVSLRDPKVVLETVAGVDRPGGYLRALHPQHPQFELLRRALLKARAGAAIEKAEEDVVTLPARGPTLKLGVEHAEVALLRQRFKVVAATPEAEQRFDEPLRDAVVEFQRKRGITADGIVGAGTRAVINGTERSGPVYGTDEQRLIVNMERWRWMPEDLGEFHVWDNVPEYQTRVLKNGQLIHQARIIVGKPGTQTVVFSANMRSIVFGPEWGVPDSIKIKEYLPYLRRPAYESGGLFGFGGGTVADTRILERQNMRVVYNGRTVDASQIDWSNVDIRRYSFIQAAGPGNALGAVKFLFPNKHDIYMHDTPMRDLFSRTVRTFSHGCVRVQDPGKFAEVLLAEDKGWSSARVRELMARGGNNEVTLSKVVPVHITYFTAIAAESGEVTSFADIYGHDRRVASALAGRPIPLETVQSLDTAVQEIRSKKEPIRTKQAYDSQEDLFSSLFGN